MNYIKSKKWGIDRALLGALLFTLIIVLFSARVFAQDFTQGYSTEQSLIRGSLVGLVEGEENKIEAITSERNEDLLGIVIRSNDSAVTLTEDTTGVFVATTGRYEVLVSDQNGTLNIGDDVTTSSLSGIAMKNDNKQKIVLGKVLDKVDFQDTNSIISTAQVTDSGGNERVVRIARVLVQIDVKGNPGLRTESGAPQFLVEVSESVAGEPVSALRIYAGLVTLLIPSIISGTLLYSSIKTSIISIGRNPLSKSSVLKGLVQVIFISLIIFISGVVAVYLILTI